MQIDVQGSGLEVELTVQLMGLTICPSMSNDNSGERLKENDSSS